MKLLIGNSIADDLRSDLESAFPAGERVDASIGRFPSTEAFSEILGSPEQVKGEPVIVVQSLGPVAEHSSNDFAMQLLLTVSTLKRHGAGPIWTILPFMGYSRQDRSRANHMDSIAADDFSFLLKQAGVVGVSSVEMHSEGGLELLKNQFGGNVYTIDPTELYREHLVSTELQGPVVGGPDHGAHERAETLATTLGAEQFHVAKKRDQVEVSNTKLVSFEGQVSGHDAVIVDDMIDTGGTAENCAKRLKEEGALRVLMCTAHFIGSHEAMRRLLDSKTTSGSPVFDQIVVTNTIDVEPQLQNLKLAGGRRRVSVLSVGSLLNNHIREVIAPHPAMQPEPK